jgi:hypothetical protein
MNPSTFIKQPWEERQLEFDVTNALATNDTVKSVDSITVLLSDVSQSSMVSGSSSLVGNKVYQKIVGGLNGLNYTIRVRITSNNGDKIEDEIVMKVRDT